MLSSRVWLSADIPRPAESAHWRQYFMVTMGGTYIIQIPSWTIRTRAQIVVDIHGTCGKRALAASDWYNIGTLCRMLKNRDLQTLGGQNSYLNYQKILCQRMSVPAEIWASQCLGGHLR
jgi:hypothetical protein